MDLMFSVRTSIGFAKLLVPALETTAGSVFDDGTGRATPADGEGTTDDVPGTTVFFRLNGHIAISLFIG